MLREIRCVGAMILWAALLCLPGAPVRAQAVNPELIVASRSEVIVLGTVTDLQPVTEAFPGGRPAGLGKARNLLVTLRVDAVLKGQAGAQVLAEYTTYMDGKDPQVKDQGVFQLDWDSFTRENQPVYSIAWMSTADTAEKIAAFLKTLPTVTASYSGTFAFGQPAPVTLKIHNPTNTPLQVEMVALKGRMFITRVQQKAVPFTLAPAPADPTGTPGQPAPATGEYLTIGQTIAANGDLAVSVNATCVEPESWKLFVPQSFLRMPAGVRAEMRYRAGNHSAFMTSPTSLALIGFPIPAFPPGAGGAH